MRQAEPFDKILAVVATLVVLTAAPETALSHESKIASEPKFCIESKKLCDEGNVFLARGQFSEAEPYFRKALKLSPNYGRAWRELGVVLGKKGKKSAEIKAYEKLSAATQRILLLTMTSALPAPTQESQQPHKAHTKRHSVVSQLIRSAG